MPNALVGGTSLHYEVDGAGEPCLVIHGGLGMDHVLYRRTLQRLAEGSRLVFFDQRHNGRSGRPAIGTVTMEQLADDTAELASELGFDRFAVLGHSYGGFVAQELCLRHPDRVTRAVLVSTTPGQLGTGESPDDTEPGPPMPPEAAAVLSTLPASDADLATAMASVLPHYFRRWEPERYVPLVDGTVFDRDAMVRGFEVLAGWSSVDRLGHIRCPVLCVAGRHDVFTSWPQAWRIARRIADAEVVVLEGSGHFPWVEEPDGFFEVVGAFLAAGRPAGGLA